MKTQQNKTGKRILKLTLVFIALALLISFSTGMYSGITSHMGTTDAIETSLRTHCNCKSIAFDHAAFGITISKKDGLSGNAVSYTLKECDVKNSVEEEAERLHTIFQQEINGYNDIELLHLNFETENSIETITYRNGTIVKE